MSTEQAPVWLTVKQAAARCQCGTKAIYRAVKAKKLRAARIGDRRDLRFAPEWVDDWLVRCSTPVEVWPRRAS